ncbi:hypothetical protein [Flavobacterium cerinum]|uniref:Uncharacterized protein n=1 Tax=Flavobacterium cerinum TaxID=2502784 RepID=A0ABY5IQV3_9FLAO|nr:hypothetical protein [Flavobacterium cerinum]UUC44660.1 hypothetical protein NOX80_13595 [Flavobacterium cerinum]
MKTRSLSVIFLIMAIYSFTQLYFYFDDLDFTHQLFKTLIIVITVVIAVIMVGSYLNFYFFKRRRYINRK